MPLIATRNYIECINEMGDAELFQAYIKSEPGKFRDAAKCELVAERLYKAGDIEDEIDRFLELRTREHKADREEFGRYGDVDLACKEREI